MQSMHLHDYLSWNGPSWSISCEWSVYLLFPALAWVLFKLNRFMLALWVVACMGILATLAIRFGSLDVTYDFGFVRCLAEFSSGIVLYRIYLWHIQRHRAASDSLLTILFLSILALLCLSHLVNFQAMTQVFAVFLMGIFVLALATNQSGVWQNILGSRVFQWLGTISYSIYMVHAFPVYLATTDSKQLLGRKLIGWDLSALESWLVLLAAYAAICGVATLTYRYVERPCRDLANRLVGKVEFAAIKTNNPLFGKTGNAILSGKSATS